MKTIGFGIIGAGNIAAKFAAAVRLTEGATVVAVASKTAQRAADFARNNGIGVSCGYDELLARDDIDAVYIATTHNFHYEIIKRCLCAGKHVICEKAMVLHKDEVKELFAMAGERKLFLMEAMWSRFLPSMRKAREWIESGEIGKIQSVSGVIAFKGDGDESSRLMNPALAGGAMYDIGVYVTEISSFLVGERITGVKGSVRRDSRTGVDSRVSFVLSFETADACLQCLLTANAKEYIIVNGDRGYIEIPTAHISNECSLFGAERELREHFKTEFPEGNGFVYEVRETVDCINSGRTQSATMPESVTYECVAVFEELLGERE